jgi:hypothetical protein
MQIVIELPDDICDRLQLKSANLSHRILDSSQQTTIVKITLAQQKFAECLTFHLAGKHLSL